MSKGPIFTGNDTDDVVDVDPMSSEPDFDGFGAPPVVSAPAASVTNQNVGNVVSINSRGKQEAITAGAAPIEMLDIGGAIEAEDALADIKSEPLAVLVGRVRAQELSQDNGFTDVTPMSHVVDAVESALSRLPGADESTRQLALGILRQELAREIAIHPDCLGSDEHSQVARKQVLMASAERFGRTWVTIVKGTDGRDRQLASDIFKLVSTTLGGQAERIQLALDTHKSREDLLKLGHAPSTASTSNLVSQAISGMWNASAQTVRGVIDGIKKGVSQNTKKVTAATLATDDQRVQSMVPKPTPPSVTEAVEPLASSSDVEMTEWRAKRLEDSLREAERLAEELSLNAGDADWESGRGLELKEDFKKAIETVNAMADDKAIDPSKMDAVMNRLEGIRSATEEAVSKSVTDKMKDQIVALAEMVKTLFQKVKDGVHASLGIQGQSSRVEAEANAMDPSDASASVRRTPKMS